MTSQGCVLCSIAQSCLTLCGPWTTALQAPLSLEFSMQEYWSGLPFPTPGDIPNPVMDTTPPALTLLLH